MPLARGAQLVFENQGYPVGSQGGMGFPAGSGGTVFARIAPVHLQTDHLQRYHLQCPKPILEVGVKSHWEML